MTSEDPEPHWPPDPKQHRMPLRPGWRITYRDKRTEMLESGMIRSVVPVGSSWRITTTDGYQLTPDRVLAVTRMKGGIALEHWTTRHHGLDGMDGRLSTHSRPSYEEW